MSSSVFPGSLSFWGFLPLSWQPPRTPVDWLAFWIKVSLFILIHIQPRNDTCYDLWNFTITVISLDEYQLPSSFLLHTLTLCPCVRLCVYHHLLEERIGFGSVGPHQAHAISHVDKSHAHLKERKKKKLADHQSLIFVFGHLGGKKILSSLRNKNATILNWLWWAKRR